MPSMVGWPVENPRTLRNKEWTEAVLRAKQKLEVGRSHRRATREDLWVRSEEQYEGNHWYETNDESSDLIVVNMSFSTVNVIMPYMTGNDPKFLVIPYSGNATQRNAAIQQALLNRQWRSRKLAGRKHSTDAAWSYLVHGDGFLKAGYNIIDKRNDEGDYVEVAQLWVASVSPWDIYIDPRSDGLHNARWVCQRLWLTKDEVEEDNRYSNKSDTNVAYTPASEGHRESKDTDTETGMTEEVHDGSEYAQLYEFYDLVKRQMIVFSAGEYPLQVVEDIEQAPIAQLPNYKIPNSPWHMGELEQIWSLQQELNKTRSHLITHRRRNVAKLFAKRQSLKQDAIDALQSPIVNDVAFVDGEVPLDDLVKPLELPNLSADVYNVSSIMQEDIYEITGVNEYLRGAGPDIRRTATEASIIEGASNIKSQFKLTQIEETTREIGAILLGIMADVFPQTEYDELQLYLSGRDAEAVKREDIGQQMAEAEGDSDMMAELQAQMEQPADAIVSPSPDIFEGEYEVEVESHSTELRNPVLKEQKAREMVEIIMSMAQILPQFGVNINYVRLFEDWFEKAGIDDIEGLLEGAGQPTPSAGMPPPAGAGPGALSPGMPPPSLQDPSLMGMLGPDNTGAFGAEGSEFPVA